MRFPTPRQLTAPALVLAVAFVGAACGPGATPAPATPAPATPGPGETPGEATPTLGPRATVTIGISQQIFSFMPLYVGHSKGFWDDLNLDVELTFFSSGSETQQALLADAFMIGAGGYTESFTLSGQGTDTPIFAFIEGKLPYRMMARSEITTLEELRGGTLAVSRIGALSDQITRILLTQAGEDPNDFEYQQAGGSPARFAALEAGAVDGALLDSPTFQLALDAGYNSLLNAAEILPDFPYEVMYAKREVIEANYEVFQRFMQGYVQAATFATDPANRDEVIDIAAEYLELEREVSAIGYDTTIQDFPPDGEPTLVGVQAALEGTREFGSIPGIENLNAEDILYRDLYEDVTGN
jgi:NitT/TauT family transport system substrate-binding protein